MIFPNNNNHNWWCICVRSVYVFVIWFGTRRRRAKKIIASLLYLLFGLIRISIIDRSHLFVELIRLWRDYFLPILFLFRLFRDTRGGLHTNIRMHFTFWPFAQAKHKHRFIDSKPARENCWICFFFVVVDIRRFRSRIGESRNEEPMKEWKQCAVRFESVKSTGFSFQFQFMILWNFFLWFTFSSMGSDSWIKLLS